MALQAKEQGGSHPPSSTDVVDPDHLRRPLALGGKRSAGTVSGLPDDPLVEILSRVPVNPLFRFKCVSKPWRNLIADLLHRKNLYRTLQGFFHGGIETHADSRDKNYGHFTDLLRRSMPLVDPSFSFLTKLPGIKKIILLGSCNGLLLFGHRRCSDTYDTLGYIVCNPATDQWVAVPSSGWTPPTPLEEEDSEDEDNAPAAFTYLIFDPAVSPHCQLVQLWQDSMDTMEGVHTYSSETGVWKPNEGGDEWKQWGMYALIIHDMGCTFNGLLHLIVYRYLGFYKEQRKIVAVDREGKTSRIICWPEKHGTLAFVGQSQGHLHCMGHGWTYK